MFAIRSEYFLPGDTCYAYAGKPESPMARKYSHMDWYRRPSGGATLYKSKSGAARRAKYLNALGIPCRVVELTYGFHEFGGDQWLDQAAIDLANNARHSYQPQFTR